MPGKYPTINSISTDRKPLEPGVGVGLSNSDTPTLLAMFKNSPIYTITAEDYRTTAKGYLQPITQSDTDNFPHFATPVTMDYQGAPDFPTDPTLYEGRYLPYLVAPTDPAAGTDGTSSGAIREPNDNFGSGLKVTEVTPVDTSAEISTTTIDGPPGPIGPLGQSPAHASNPGSQS